MSKLYLMVRGDEYWLAARVNGRMYWLCRKGRVGACISI